MSTSTTYDRSALIAELIRDEGERLDAYRDSVGLWAVGVGHLLGRYQRIERITEAESRALLVADIAEAEREGRSLYDVDMAARARNGWTEEDEVRHRAAWYSLSHLGPCYRRGHEPRSAS